MIDVVCFCGHSYSFVGDAGACPGCGEIVIAKLTAADRARERSVEVADREIRPIRDERPDDMAA